jgi:zinc transport system substrate-binding protein
MKKILSVIIIILITIGTSGCFKKDDLEGATIYTTVYPITYIVDTLYGNNSTISSIYPDATDISNYQLTKKQIDEYSKGDIFIYNGLSSEKQIAKDFLNKNSNLKIIDVAYGLKYDYGVEELWLSPNDFLMLASTVKTNLTDFIQNKYLIEEINENYNELEEEISIMDAELRTIASSAKEENNNTIIVSSNVFKFLNNYGFNVISLEDEENLTQNNLANIKSNFKNKNYTTIFMKDTEEKTELISTLESSYEAKIVTVNTMNTLSEENIKNSDNYISIMNEFLDNIRNVTLG